MPLLLIVLLAASASAQEPATFRAGITLVKVDAQVAARNGRPIDGLTAADFRILDEGEPQKLVHFGHETEPLDILLLLDISGSMRHLLAELAGVATAALKPLGAADRVAVVVFARQATVREDLTGDFAEVQWEIREAVHDESVGAGTVINGNIVFAAQYLARQAVRGRRAVLIVTDNQGLNYRVPDEAVIRELYAADAVLNGILIGKQRRPDPVKAGIYLNPDFTPSDIFKLAEQTGGEAMEARKAAESFREMIERIRSRYGMAYEAPPAAAGEFRRIRVELSPEARRLHPDAVVRARAGYFAAGAR